MSRQTFISVKLNLLKKSMTGQALCIQLKPTRSLVKLDSVQLISTRCIKG